METHPVEAETQTELPTVEPRTDPAADTGTETRSDKTEKQTELPAEPSADLVAMLKETEAHLLEAEKNAAEQHDACLRARAEAENIRRRAQEDVAKASKFAAEKFAGAMLPVKDSLEAALATERQTLEKLREGVELTLKQLVAAFEGTNLIEENPLGQKFDPNKHQAIGTLEAEAEPNTVINVLQKGYLLHGRVIRPAMVMVSRAKG
ncbi:MAG: nucleotide exchange factor GrpE [Proteobacteria bacterium]|nr:nucleotide exchange factor GrpE [Pseudomonadota bacterium]